MTTTTQPDEHFAAIANAAQSLLDALAAASAAFDLPVHPSHIEGIENVRACHGWRASLAERARPKGPTVMVERRGTGLTGSEREPYALEFVRQTATQIVLRDESGREHIFVSADGRKKRSPHSYYRSDLHIVDLASALAINWKAPRPARKAGQ